MKRIILILPYVSILYFLACNKQGQETETSSKSLKSYIDSVKKVTPEYTANFWTPIDEGYQVRVTKAEAAAASANASEEEKKQLEEMKASYQELKTKYDAEVVKNDELVIINKKLKQSLRDSLFGQGKIGAELNFDWVTGKNIKGIYENFVNTVDKNKKIYSREDWDEVKVLYEALDTRKNEVEKELSTKDNLKIAKQKIRFASIESMNRPFAKVSENLKSKNK